MPYALVPVVHRSARADNVQRALAWLAQGWVALFQLFFAIPFAFPAAIVGRQISSVQQARVARLRAVGMSVAGASLVPVQMWEGRAQSQGRLYHGCAGGSTSGV